MDIIGLWVELVRAYYEEKGVRSRTIQKQVVCENCRTLYVYLMHRSAGATGFHAERNISHLARRALRRKLEQDCELVPCPACGFYQECMNQKARKAARREMPAASVVLTLASAPLFIAAFCVWDRGRNPTTDQQSLVIGILIAIAGALCLFLGLGLAVAKYIRASRLDLNTRSRFERQSIGRSQASIISGDDDDEGTRKSDTDRST